MSAAAAVIQAVATGLVQTWLPCFDVSLRSMTGMFGLSRCMSAIFSHSQGDCVRGQHGICGVTWRGLGVVGVVWCAVSYYAVYGDFWGDCHIYAGQMANCAKARGLCLHWSICAYSFRFL